MPLQFSIKLHLAKHVTVLVAVSLGRCKVLAQGSCAASEGSGQAFGTAAVQVSGPGQAPLALLTALRIQTQCPSAISWPLAVELRRHGYCCAGRPWLAGRGKPLPSHSFTPSQQEEGENWKDQK